MLKPEELEKVEFSVSFRGYNPDQVDKYIDDVVETVGKLTQKCEEYEKLCAEQEKTIASLRIGRPTEAPATAPAAFAAANDAVKNEYNMYRAKIKKLRESVHDFKSEAFSLFQKQIIEIQSFDLDGGDFDASEQLVSEAQTDDKEAFENEAETETVSAVEETPAVSAGSDAAAAEVTEEVKEEVREEVTEEASASAEPNAPENASGDDINELISELSGVTDKSGAAKEASISDDTLESLINDLSGTVADAAEELEVKPPKAKLGGGKDDDNSANSSIFNSMFITDVDGEES